MVTLVMRNDHNFLRNIWVFIDTNLSGKKKKGKLQSLKKLASEKKRNYEVCSHFRSITFHGKHSSWIYWSIVVFLLLKIIMIIPIYVNCVNVVSANLRKLFESKDWELNENINVAARVSCRSLTFNFSAKSCQILWIGLVWWNCKESICYNSYKTLIALLTFS